MPLQEYTNQFFGFGRWDAPVWFVGTEEAGNPNLRELPELTPKDGERMGKYLKAWQYLQGFQESSDRP